MWGTQVEVEHLEVETYYRSLHILSRSAFHKTLQLQQNVTRTRDNYYLKIVKTNQWFRFHNYGILEYRYDAFLHILDIGSLFQPRAPASSSKTLECMIGRWTLSISLSTVLRRVGK